MRIIKRLVAVVLVLIILSAATAITVVGPWPVYAAGHYKDANYYTNALANLSDAAAGEDIRDIPGKLQAGWATVDMTPQLGVPLGGYGQRDGKGATGVHDPLYVKALAISDGTDTAVIVGADMLTITPNLSDPIRQAVAADSHLDAGAILFNATHSHSGPAGYIPGYAATLFGGDFVEDLPAFLIDKFTTAILAAVNDLEPARLDHGTVKAPQFIKNRTRAGDVDTNLDWMFITQDDGDLCYVVRYSAHPTVIGASNLEFSPGFPGYLQTAIKENTGATCIYLGGAVGSMGPRAPEGNDHFGRAENMGVGLAEKVLEATQSLNLKDRLDVASVGAYLQAPPFQVRLFGPDWRLSPIAVQAMGLTRDSWIHAVRVGDLLLAGTPSDFSGELSVRMRDWAEDYGYTLWCLSFNGAYNGYVSPDEYYGEVYDDNGNLEYETAQMSWAGPDQAAFFTDLIKHAADEITPETLQ